MNGGEGVREGGGSLVVEVDGVFGLLCVRACGVGGVA